MLPAPSHIRGIQAPDGEQTSNNPQTPALVKCWEPDRSLPGMAPEASHGDGSRDTWIQPVPSCDLGPGVFSKSFGLFVHKIWGWNFESWEN